MKIFVFGDPHFKVNNVNDTDEMCKRIHHLINLVKPDLVVCLGDVLDRHEQIHVSPLKRATEFFIELSQKYKLYVLIGNHDRPNNSNFLTGEHPFVGLKNNTNIVICDTVKRLTLPNKKDIVFVPYVSPGRFQEALDTSKGNPIQLIFAHQEFKGAKYGPGGSVVGDMYPLDGPFVISGHIHEYDLLQKNLLYLGTPIQHSINDPCDKVMCVVTIDFSKNKPISELCTTLKESESENINSLRKQIVYDRIVIDTIVSNVAKKKIKKIQAKDLSSSKIKFDSDTEYKIVICGSEEEIISLNKSKELISLKSKLKDTKHSSLSFERENTNIEMVKIEENIPFLEKLRQRVSNIKGAEDILKEVWNVGTE